MVNLTKYDPCHDLPRGPDREEWQSCVMLPLYLTTVFPTRTALKINSNLARNDLRSFATLLRLEHNYDNVTGEW